MELTEVGEMEKPYSGGPVGHGDHRGLHSHLLNERGLSRRII